MLHWIRTSQIQRYFKMALLVQKYGNVKWEERVKYKAVKITAKILYLKIWSAKYILCVNRFVGWPHFPFSVNLTKHRKRQ